MSRDIEIRITAAAQTGFVAQEAGEIVAAFSTRHELARWIEERLGDLSRRGGSGGDGNAE